MNKINNTLSTSWEFYRISTAPIYVHVRILAAVQVFSSYFLTENKQTSHFPQQSYFMQQNIEELKFYTEASVNI